MEKSSSWTFCISQYAACVQRSLGMDDHHPHDPRSPKKPARGFDRDMNHGTIHPATKEDMQPLVDNQCRPSYSPEPQNQEQPQSEEEMESGSSREMVAKH